MSWSSKSTNLNNNNKYMINQINNDLSYLHTPNSDDDEDDRHSFDFQPITNQPLHGSNLSGWSSTDRIDSMKYPSEDAGKFSALKTQIDQKIKGHMDVLLHSVGCLSARVSQMETRTRQLENNFDELKDTIEFNHRNTSGKLRELEDMLEEVHSGIQDLRDKQEIVAAQIQLVKLQALKDKPNLSKQNNVVQAHAQVPSVSNGSLQPLPVPYLPPPTSNPMDWPPPHHAHTFASPTSLPTATAPQLPLIPRQVANYVPQHSMILKQEAHYMPQHPTLPPPEAHHAPQIHSTDGIYQQNQFPEVPQLHPPPYTHQSYLQPSQSVPQHFNRHYPEYNAAISQLQGPMAPTSNDFYYSASSPRNGLSNMEPLHLSKSPSNSNTESSSSQLPVARLLPKAIPTATPVDDGPSSSTESGNNGPTDDVVDKVVAMGFRRDLVRATVKKLKENGNAADLNAVLDKLMNNG